MTEIESEEAVAIEAVEILEQRAQMTSAGSVQGQQQMQVEITARSTT